MTYTGSLANLMQSIGFLYNGRLLIEGNEIPINQRRRAFSLKSTEPVGVSLLAITIDLSRDHRLA